MGSTVGGAILTNDLGGEDPFAMTSAATFTGTGNTDLFLDDDDDDDDVSMRFTAANVIGLFVITDETPAIKESIT